MTLEFEKLTEDVEQMAASAARRQKARQNSAAAMLALLHDKATAWDEIAAVVEAAKSLQEAKYFRPARPIDEHDALDAAIAAPPPPDRATIVASDGSQILPDRHSAFLYYLVNIGVMVFHHGDSQAPEVIARPSLVYAVDEDLSDEDQGIDPTKATIARDLGEIGLIADIVQAQSGLTRPVLGLLDQRLLYWPFGERQEADRVADEWQAAMSRIRQHGALLAGYIDRPGKRSVVGLLRALQAGAPEAIRLLDRPGQSGDLADINLFGALLGPGERSRIFAEISPVNKRFAKDHPDNEVCFFYFNPTRSRPDQAELAAPAIARVDVPMWVARDPAAVAAVHGLLESQCRILADYPYVLARADEIAVVGRNDEAELDMMIDLAMQRYGVNNYMTSKLYSKELARGGRTRLKGF